MNSALAEIMEFSIANPEDLSALDGFIEEAFPDRRLESILLVNPPDASAQLFDFATAKRGRYWNYPPYGLGLLAQQARRRGFRVQILNLNDEVLRLAREAESQEQFDFNAAWQDVVRKTIEAERPDLIGISCMFSQTHPALVDVSRFLREQLPDVPQALGGVHVTNSLEELETRAKFLEDLNWVDLFFSKEADRAFPNFLDYVVGRADGRDVGQLFLNRPTNVVRLAGLIPPGPEDLDMLPAHDLLRPDALSPNGKIGSFFCHKPAHTLFATVLSNRGCRAQCTFCSVRNFNGVGVRRRGTQSVIDELKMLRQEYGIGHIMWLDDDFLYDRRKSMELFNEMVRQDVGLTWDCSNGVIAASCTDEMISAAAAAGCIGLNIGMESGNKDILRSVKKPGTVKNFLKAAEVLRKFEQINARVFLMIGFPGETYRQILDTIEVSQEMDLDWYNVTILQPLPNTPIFDQMVAEGMIDGVSFSETRFNSGGYGKAARKGEVDRPTDMAALDFKDAFNDVDLDTVPTKQRVDDIWAYMNYHLNFKRLFGETRPAKLKQQTEYVTNIVDIVAPNNGFALYFLGYLQHRMHGAIDPALPGRLEAALTNSRYWSDRFSEFGLSASHLANGRFPSV